MKNYLIISEDKLSINDNINKILKEIGFNKEDVIKFDMEETLLENAIEELNTYGFFTENKVVILNSCSFLSPNKKRGTLSQNEDVLLKYISNPNPLNTLIIICDKLDERKKISKELRKKLVLVEDTLNIKDKIKSSLEGFLIANTTIDYLISYLNNDNTRIMNELEKLKLYKTDEKEITKEDINQIVIKEFTDDIFTLINLILKKDINNALVLYKNLINRGEELTKIVITLVDQYRLIYKVKILFSGGYSKDEITNMLKIHPYRVKLALEESYNYSNDELLNYLQKLGNIDIGIKTGELTPDFAFEMFLLGIK